MTHETDEHGTEREDSANEHPDGESRAGHESHHHGPPPGEPKHFFDYPENVARVLGAFYIAAAFLAIIGLVAQFTHWPYHPHPAFAEDVGFTAGGFEIAIPAFYCLYGFVACVLLVLAATQLRKILMREEDYYDGE